MTCKKCENELPLDYINGICPECIERLCDFWEQPCRGCGE